MSPPTSVTPAAASTTALANRKGGIHMSPVTLSVTRARAKCFLLAALGVFAPCALAAQDPPSLADSLSRWRKSDFLTPFGSMFVPGLGQYVHRAYLTGLVYTGTAAASYA